MKLSNKHLKELQNRLKVGNKRGVHLNARPLRSPYKFDLERFSAINKNLPSEFVNQLLSKLPFKFKLSWKNDIKGYDKLNDRIKAELTKNNRSLENLVNQTDSIKSEKGVNTFGFGYPLLVNSDV